MSTRIKIAIVEPSLIVRSGLLDVLTHLVAISVDVIEINDVSELESTLISDKPDILILNPIIYDVKSLNLSNNTIIKNIKIISLDYNNRIGLENDLEDYFDENLYLDDNAELIKSKIDKIVFSIKNLNEDDKSKALSRREKEIIICVVKGMTNKEIAEKLFLSVHTVQTHRRNIATKLDIHSSAGLTIYAIVNKLVSINEINL